MNRRVHAGDDYALQLAVVDLGCKMVPGDRADAVRPSPGGASDGAPGGTLQAEVAVARLSGEDVGGVQLLPNDYRVATATRRRAGPQVEGARVLVATAVSRGSPVEGTFRLEAAKQGAGGTATVHQGGRFRLVPGGEAVLGEVAVCADDQISARLRLSWAGGSTACRTGA